MKEKEIPRRLKEQKYLTIQTLKDAGLSYYQIRRLVETNQLRKLNRFSYENLQYAANEGEYSSLHVYVRQGILCLWSAANYHGISNVRSPYYEVAIAQKSRVFNLPEWPPIKLNYFGDARLRLGVTTMSESDGSFAVYDREKTVCDLLLHRNKTSLEDVLAVLKTYLQLADRDIPKLLAYAKQLRCYPLMKQYLEVLL